MDISTPAVSPLRQRMIEDMRMRKLEAKTQQAYVRAIVKLSAYLGRSPATATAEDLRSFFVAARHFTRDLLSQRGSVPPADVPWTWERAHEQRNSDLGYAHALRDVRMGEYEVGESSAEEKRRTWRTTSK